MNPSLSAIGDDVSGVANLTHEVEDDTPYWIAFRLAEVASANRMLAMVERFGSAREAWKAPASQLRAVLGNRERMLGNLLKARDSIDPLKEAELLDAAGVRVVTLANDGYPRLLREISAPPPVLFHRGAFMETDDAAVAIVGTRRATAYGRDMARQIAGDLASAGITIVSGLAHGVDGIAHQAALEADGRTFAVLGSGIHDIYPREHKGLAQRVADQGALISDNVPYAKPDRWNFPARNRIISGLSLGVVVIEAPEKSGALITVDFAADQGRDVFAVPGPVHSAASAGCLKIMREGARPIRNAEDVIEDLRLNRVPMEDVSQPALFLEDDDRRVLHVLTGTPLHIDDVVEASGLPLPRVSVILLTLELRQLATNTGAQHYTRR
jgi:DNA processing protein